MPRMGDLAATDVYDPNAFDVPLEQSTGVGWANRLAERLPGAVMGGLAQTVMTPGAMMSPNPYPPGSEEAAFYDASKTAAASEWAPGMALNMMGGGVAGTGKTPGPALGAGPTDLWHGVSGVKLPKPIAEMESVVRPVNPAPEKIINPASLQNSWLMPLLGDRSAAAAALERVNGYRFDNPVSLEGGHGYMANNPMAWAAGKSIAPGIAGVARTGAETGLPVHGVYTAMGERSVDFSHMPSDALVEMLKHTKVTREGAKAFNDTMKAIAPSFPGVRSPRLGEFLNDAPGGFRNTFVKKMDTAEMQGYGFPSVAEARVAVTDPRLLNEPTGAAGLSIARMDPKGTLGPSGHATYETGIAGDYIGGLGASVPKEIMFPDIIGPLSKHADAVLAARVAEGKTPFRPTEDYLMSRVPQGLPKLQKADQQWVDRISQHLTDRGFTLGSGAIDKKAAAALQATGGIRAYHGSPHDFERFDLSKIGTGEGAQAYGHGLYFAGAEDVAKSYRDALKTKGILNQVGMTEPQRIAAEIFDSYRGQDLRNALDDARHYENGVAIAAELRKLHANPPKGHMYEVNINADPAHFLDWDKGLSGQSPAVRQYLESDMRRYFGPSYEGQVGGHASMPAGDLLGQTKGRLATSPIVSSEMREAGIPGIKYLDQGSRGAGTGSSNYVVFDDKLIDILKKYGLAGLPAGAAGMGALAAQDRYE